MLKFNKPIKARKIITYSRQYNRHRRGDKRWRTGGIKTNEQHTNWLGR